MKLIRSLCLVIMTNLLITACDGLLLNIPPVFTTALAKYAVDNGSNVNFTITVLYNPTSVTCFGGNVVMSNTGTNQWSGTANYTNDLTHHASGQNPGINSVACTAINAYGTSNSVVGSITLIPNVAPNIVMLPTQTICGNNGNKTFNEPLVDFTATTYVTGAVYTLTAGDLPAGLSINPTNGNLVGTTTQAGSYSVNLLRMTATTVVDATESNNFSIQLSSTACP